MTSLRFALGSLWLMAVCFFVFFIPCRHLWHSQTCVSFRPRAQESSFVVFGAMKTLCFMGSVTAMGLAGIVGYEEFCACTAWTLFVLGVLVLYFEAPVRGLFDADDEEVLGDEEMLALWYGGLNVKYLEKEKESYRTERYSPLSGRAGEINFLRTIAWAWDNPSLRVAAYYFKGQGALFLVSFLMLLAVAHLYGTVASFRGSTYELARNAASSSFSWLDVWFDVMMVLFCVVFFFFANAIRREWMPHCRELILALKEGRDPDLSDRARMAEMRRTVLGWGVNSGYVRYDRDRGVWQLNAQKGRIIG